MLIGQLKIFGKPFERVQFSESIVAECGLMRFYIEHYGPVLRPSIAFSDKVHTGEPLATQSQCVDWLESEARRIMRECFEIAGPMTAGRWGEQGLPVLFDDQCSGAFRPARLK